MGKTRIQVSEKTRSTLREIGKKGQSYDELITELIELIQDSKRLDYDKVLDDSQAKLLYRINEEVDNHD